MLSHPSNTLCAPALWFRLRPGHRLLLTLGEHFGRWGCVLGGAAVVRGTPQSSASWAVNSRGRRGQPRRAVGAEWSVVPSCQSGISARHLVSRSSSAEEVHARDHAPDEHERWRIQTPSRVLELASVVPIDSSEQSSLPRRPCR